VEYGVGQSKTSKVRQSLYSLSKFERYSKVLDKRFKEDDLAIKKKALNTFVNLKRNKDLGH